MRCPNCGSKMIFPATDHKSFSTGKAVAGAVAVGVIGAAAGFIGKDIKGYRCGTCGSFSKEPMGMAEEMLIDTAVNEANRTGSSVSYNRFHSKYPGIEQVASSPRASQNSNQLFLDDSDEFEDETSSNLPSVKIKRTITPNKFVAGSPVFVVSATIKEGSSSDTLSMNIRNISGKPLRSVYFKVAVFDDVGDQITECSCVYQGLSTAPGEYLPVEKEFDLKTDVAYNVTIACEKAAFKDDSVWRQSEALVEYDIPECVEITSQNFTLYKPLRDLLSKKASIDADKKIYRPVFEDGCRSCICGTPVIAEEKCPVCGLDEGTLLSVIDYDNLTAHRRNAIKETAQKRAKEMQAILEQAQEQKYKEGLRLMKKDTKEDYLAAIQIFTALDNYKDASNQTALCIERVNTLNHKAEIARKDAIYDAAIALMKKSIARQENFLSAIKEFEKIPGWKDANEQIAICAKRAEECKAQEEARRLERERQAELDRQAAAVAAKKRKNRNIALAIASVSLVLVLIFAYSVITENNRNNQYNNGLSLLESGKYEEAIAVFEALDGYKDSSSKIAECNTSITEREYNKAVSLMNEGKYTEAIATFQALGGHKDCTAKINECKYNTGVSLMNAGKYIEAALAFGAIADYRDARTQSFALWDKIAVRETIAAGYNHTVGLKANGTVVAVGINDGGFMDDGQCNVLGWKDIVAISASGTRTVGLKADGTVVAVGDNNYGQRNVSGWKDIVAIAAGSNHTVGLKADGTVVAVGKNDDDQCNVSDWKNIVAIAAGWDYTIGLRANGTVVAVGSKSYGKCNVSGWKNIIAIAAGYYHTVGLKADGTVVVVGDDEYGQRNVSSWKDIVAISASQYHTIGLKADGTVVAAGKNYLGQPKVSGWKNIVAIAAGSNHTVGLKANGMVVAVGSNSDGQCNVSNWKKIKVPERD